jgi:RNA polymerase sigma factor (sigma-70 family)
MPDEVDIQPDAGNRLELYDALAALPPRQYQAVVLTYWGGNRSAECATDDDTPSGMTQNQVAAEMGISQQAVARLLDSAKKTLREVVKAGCQSHT